MIPHPDVTQIDFAKGDGLVPAVVQDVDTRRVLMLGYMNREAFETTLRLERVTFFSRSRQCLWTKGETSGHFLDAVEMRVDCDADALLVLARPHGPVCHTGTDTCWAQPNTPLPLSFLSDLQEFIIKRKAEMPEGSYTTSLFRDGINRIAQKLGEEALETVIETVNGSNERVIYEASDMLYHLIVLLTAKDLRIEQVVVELAARHSPGWKKH